MMRRRMILGISVALCVIAYLCLRPKDSVQTEYLTVSGGVFGTTYKITLQADSDYHGSIMRTLQEVDNSLSTFNKTSVITKINNNEPVTLDEHFIRVFNLAMQVSEDTDGAFDITVAPLVNAWGFGFKTKQMPTEDLVDSLKQYVGYKAVSLNGSKVKKQNLHIMLDCSAIAKGYGVDAVADMLKAKGVKNFMVEIGGEVVTLGVNPKGDSWKIGVVKPTDDSLNINNEVMEVLEVNDKAMATSGNYRRFYVEDGKKYAHTIDPASGYPVQHSLLSATVFGPTCAIADAYATSFMVMGLEKAKALLDRHPELMAYFIYSDEKGENQVWKSKALKVKE